MNLVIQEAQYAGRWVIKSMEETLEEKKVPPPMRELVPENKTQLTHSALFPISRSLGVIPISEGHHRGVAKATALPAAHGRIVIPLAHIGSFFTSSKVSDSLPP